MTILSFFTLNISIRRLWTNLYHKEDLFLKIWPLFDYFSEIYSKICDFAPFFKKKIFPLKIKQKTCPCIFSILGVASFSLLFPKAPASRGKTKIWSNFCCIILLFAWAQKVCPKIFENLFQTEDINIFVPHGVLFSRNVQLKSSEKTAVKSETLLKRT